MRQRPFRSSQNSAMAVGIPWRKPMLDWIGTKILALMTLLPAVFVDEKSPDLHRHPGDVRLGLHRSGRISHCDAAVSVHHCALHARDVKPGRAEALKSCSAAWARAPARSHPDRSARRSARGDDQCPKQPAMPPIEVLRDGIPRRNPRAQAGRPGRDPRRRRPYQREVALPPFLCRETQLHRAGNRVLSSTSTSPTTWHWSRW